MLRLRVMLRLRIRLEVGESAQVYPHRLRLRLGGGVDGSVLIATPDSVHGTFFGLQLLMPQHHIHIPPRPLLFRHYEPTKG